MADAVKVIDGVLESIASEQVRCEHAAWSQATFSGVGPVGPLKHLSKELAKLFRKITNSEIDAEGNAHVVLSPADSLLINNARIALASLEAEAVACIDRANLDYLESGADADVWPASGAGSDDVLLYAAPQLPQPAVLSVSEGVLKSLLPDVEKSEFWFEHNGKIFFEGVRFNNAVFEACCAAMLQAEPVSNSDELPLDYLQGHKDGLEWAAQLAEANDPQTGDWLYDDPIELARAIRKGPDMPTSQDGNSPVTPDCWIPVSERMPDDDDFVYIWPRPDFGIELHVGQYCECHPKGDGWYAQVYEQNYGIEWHPIIVTHWMPLPAAPRQEVK
ncbi:DUF550 domain-containing protein [Citrobacter freundii]|nr:dATP/dGTP pyrophosphohydrolase domain-containing protein [Citrobacter freundii]MCX2444515.1 DUF550 domain-containing protein [Citrobacter freundii]MCX2472583.1 DUF550 domain-containing protein [Citrobacter freundii]